MGERGPKPQGKVKIKWSANFAYAIGLIASDGNLSPDERHILFTSKDQEMIANYLKALNISCIVGKKSNGINSDKKYFVVQFSDTVFYKFLESIGITANKSKTISMVNIPDKYLSDFIRGSFDGDGSSYSYFDKRWKSSFMLYLSFASASKGHILWLREVISNQIGIFGHITKSNFRSYYQLKFAKNESIILFKYMYKNKKALFLSRKYFKIKKSFKIAGLYVKG